MRDIAHFVDGRALAGASGRFGEVYDPNTGEARATRACTSPVLGS